jgi:hypothetical protein
LVPHGRKAMDIDQGTILTLEFLKAGLDHVEGGVLRVVHFDGLHRPRHLGRHQGGALAGGADHCAGVGPDRQGHRNADAVQTGDVR